MKTDVTNIEKVGPGFLVNRDQLAREVYLKKKMAEDSKSAEIDSMKNQLNSLSSEMTEIKSLLMQLVRTSQ